MVLGHFLRTSDEELAARHARHALVGDDHVDVVAGEDHQALLRRVGREDLELSAVEAAHQRRSEIRLIVDQK